MFDPIAYGTFTFVMSITPGPNNIMLTASGATFGFRRTIPHLLGVAAGLAVELLAVCAGLGALFARWPALQDVLRWAGAAYLVYLGWHLLGGSSARKSAALRPVRFLEAAAFQFLNPKAWVMSLTAVSLFLPREMDAHVAVASSSASWDSSICRASPSGRSLAAHCASCSSGRSRASCST